MPKPTLQRERELWAECPGRRVMGVDETGYGAALGPLCVAGVIFPCDMSDDLLPEGLNDSKKLSPSRRDRLYDEIMQTAEAVGVVYASPEEIDACNVLQANLNCMERLRRSIDPPPGFVLVDGRNRPKEWRDDSCACVVGGDGISASIAAASIVAKVSRDRLMREMVLQHPELREYDAANNKGYLSQKHRDALDLRGRTRFHRQSYRYSWQQSAAGGADIKVALS